jgi:hypothetical protein
MKQYVFRKPFFVSVVSLPNGSRYSVNLEYAEGDTIKLTEETVKEIQEMQPETLEETGK